MMKSITYTHLKYLLAVLVWAFSWAFAQSQPCLVDSQYLNPGIYPSDTLPDMQAGVSYDEVVQMVVPADTFYMGIQLDFDSIIITAIGGIPAAITWECNANQNACHYYGNGIDPIRFCFRLTGTPMDTTLGLPGWDSIMVTLKFFVNIPFSNNYYLQDYPLYYRKGQSVSLDPVVEPTSGLQLSPNPMGNEGCLRFVMEEGGPVDIHAIDAFGRCVWEMQTQFLQAGNQKIHLKLDELPAGVYFLHVLVPGRKVGIERLVKLNWEW